MWLAKFKSKFTETILDLLWRHWTALSVFGQVRPTAPFPLDPEALIIATLHFGRRDPRLFDAALEWWIVNGEWLSATRLRNLTKHLDPIENRILAASIQVALLDRGPKKWRTLSADANPRELAGAEADLFLTDDRALPRSRYSDPTFLQFGLVRPPFERRNVASEVRANDELNIRFRLRGLFGVTSRAEAVLYLLTHRRPHPRLIARQTFFSHPSISTALKQMVFSGLVHEHRLRREVEYGLDHKSWSRFIGFDEAIKWLSWPYVFRAFRRAEKCMEELGSKPISDRIIQSEIRKCMGKVNALLEEGEFGYSLTIPDREQQSRGLGWFAEGWERALNDLGSSLEPGELRRLLPA